MRPLLACALVASVVAACTGTDRTRPGTAVGTFTVTAALEEDDCGDAPDPWSFAIELRRDRSSLYWVQGGVPIEGSLDANRSATLASTTQVEARAADRKAGVEACVLVREDSMVVTLGTDPVDRFTGSLTYRFRAEEGSDCLGVVGQAPGAPRRVPCTVRYRLDGARGADGSLRE